MGDIYLDSSSRYIYLDIAHLCFCVTTNYFCRAFTDELLKWGTLNTSGHPLDTKSIKYRTLEFILPK